MSLPQPLPEGSDLNTINSRNRRVDVSIGNESNAIFISPGNSKAAIDDTNLSNACELNQLIVVNLDQDDGIIARIVLGDLNKQEKNEWVECDQRLLDLPDGELIVCGGNEYVDSQSTPQYVDSQEGKFYERFQIKPDKYLVSVYTHLPSFNGFRLTKAKNWPGTINYFRSSWPRKKVPGWLIERATLLGEDTDAIIQADRFDERYNNVEPVDFVIQLQAAKPGEPFSTIQDGCELTSKARLPERCPLGIIPKLSRDKPPPQQTRHTAKQTRPTAKSTIDEIPKQPKVDDKAKTLETYKVFADQLQSNQCKSAAEYFVPSLRQEVVKHLKKWCERRCGLKPTFRVWLDKEHADDAIPRWQSGQDSPKQLCDINLLSCENYLGLIRCQFGHSNAKHFVVADCALIQTDNGTQLAGINFLFV